MRRQYRDILTGRIQAGDIPSLLRHAFAWLGTAWGPLAGGRALVGPALGTLLVTYRCNLACTVCDLPSRARRRRSQGFRELTTEAFEAVLRDFRRIGTIGVGFTGGEPMLRPDLFHLLAYATRLGLHGHLNTDGFRVAGRAAELLRTGVRSVNVSLDGPDAATHDRARGRRGSFTTVVEALGALRAARCARSGPRLTAVTVLSARNLDCISDTIQTALDAGADRVGVIPVHDFGQGEERGEEHRIQEALAGLRRWHARGAIDNSLAYLDLFPRALAGMDSPLRCHAPWSSVVVDCYGNVYPCFPHLERDLPVGTIPLARLWRSPAYARARATLSACRACLWNCHTEMNLLFPQPRAAERVG